MRIPRIYTSSEQPWTVGNAITLAEDAAHHVGKVLRMTVGQQLQLFNGDGNNYLAALTLVSKKEVQAEIQAVQPNPSESAVSIHLGQGISRGDRMDFVLQKSVELGVTKITPLFTERCGVKLSGERLEKKRQQWQKIVIAACEQSGRSSIPEVCLPLSLAQWCDQLTAGLRLTLDPYATTPLAQLNPTATTDVSLLIGPEGGLTETEVGVAQAYKFQPVKLGPRILRTETAALAAITVIQYQFGDLA